MVDIYLDSAATSYLTYLPQLLIFNLQGSSAREGGVDLRGSYERMWDLLRDADSNPYLALCPGDAEALLPAVRHVILQDESEIVRFGRRHSDHTRTNVRALEGFYQLELCLLMQVASEASDSSKGFPILQGQHLEVAKKLRDVYGRWCALEVVSIWNAPSFIINYLDQGGSVEMLHKTRGIAGYEGLTQSGAKKSAAWAAHNGIPVRTASFVVEATGEHVIETGCVEVGVQEARDCMVDRQQKILSVLSELMCAFIEHGLEALRLDVFARAPWLSREAWKAMGLPYQDLAVDRANWLLKERAVCPL